LLVSCSISEAVSGDGEGLDEGLGKILDGEDLATSLTKKTSSLAVGTGEANGSSSSRRASPPQPCTRRPSRGKNGGTPRGPLKSTTSLTSLLIVGASELVLLLSVEVSADSALLVLVVLAHLDVGGVSVEFDADAIKLDDDDVVVLVDAGLLELLPSLDLLSIDGHSHLVLSLVHLQLDNRLLRDDLHLLLLSVLRDLLDENGELGLRGRAVLGQHRVAGGHGGTVDDVIERVDLAGLHGALGLGLFDEVGSEGREGTDGGHRLTTDVHQTEGHGQTVVTDGKLLGGSLDGQIGVLTGRGLDGELSADDSLLVVAVLEGAGEGAGDLVLGDELVLVEHGRLDEEGVLLERAHLVLLSLDLDLHLVLLIGSPARFDVDGEFAVLLLLQFLQGSGHLGVEHLDGRLHLPVAGILLEKRGAHSGEVDLAVSQLVVAHRSHFHLGFSLLATSDGLDLGEETVGVGLLRLVLLGVLVERVATLLLILSLLVLLSLEVLLVVLIEESLHRGSLHLLLIELLHLSLDHVDTGGIFGPVLDEGYGTGLDLGDATGFHGEGEGGLDLELLLPVHLSGHVDGDVHLGGVEKFDSDGGEGIVRMHRGDMSGGKSGTGLETQTEAIDRLPVLRLDLGLDESLNVEDGGHLGGDDEGCSHGMDDSASMLVDEGREVGVEAVSLGEDGLDLTQLDSSIADDALDHLGDDVLVDGKKGVVHITESDVDEGMRILLLLLARDDRQLREETTEDLGGLEGGGSLSTDDDLLESLLVDLLDDLVENLVDVVLAESDLSEVLVPLAGEGSLQGGHDLLGEDRVVGEEGGPVQGGSGILLLGVEGEVLVGGGEELAGLDSSHAEGGLDGIAHGLLAGDLGAGELLESGEDEGVHLGGGLSLELVHDLLDDVLLGDGLHQLMEGGDADLGMLTSVLVHGHQNGDHLAGKYRAELAKGLDGLDSDGLLLLLVTDDLLQRVDGQVHSRVGDGLQGEDLLVSGLGLLELLDEVTDESLLDVTGALALLLGFVGHEIAVLSTHSVHHRSNGEPARLTDEGVTTGILAERDERRDHLLGGDTDGGKLLEERGSLEGGDLARAHLLDQMVDGVEGTGLGEGVNLLVHSSDVFLGGETEDLDDAGEFVSSSDFDSLLLSLHLDDDGLDETRDDLGLVLELGIGGFS
ncbi:hypothetical protein PMAYCL1PPCAC_19811, partial [Pristionchus mayeri]